MREGGTYRLHAGRLREGRGTMSISLHAACSTDITGLGKSIPSRARAAIATEVNQYVAEPDVNQGRNEGDPQVDR